MDLELAQIYGTPGFEKAAAAQQEDIEKVAQAELFAKLAADNGIDLNALTDDQIAGLWNETFAKVAEEDDKDDGKKDDKAPPFAKKDDDKDDEKSKEAAAVAEFEALAEQREKLAFADKCGRVMAHAYVQELGLINQQVEKEAAAATTEQPGSEKIAKGMPEALAKHLESVGKGVTKRVSGTSAETMHKGTAKALGAGVYGAGAVGAGGTALAGKKLLGKGKEKKSSAIDELAVTSAYEKAAAAGYDTDEAAERLAAVYTLGLGESEKVASATSLDGAVEIRSLEYLEGAGYPVQWTEG